MIKFQEKSKGKRIQIEANDYVKIEIVGYVKSEPDTICEPHQHPFWELIYIKEGGGVHRIGNVSITGNKNDLCLIPPYVMHDSINEKPLESHKLYVGFTFQYSFSEGEEENVQYILENIQDIDEIKRQFSQICDLFEETDTSKKSEMAEQNYLERISMGKLIALVTKIASYVSVGNAPRQSMQDIRNKNMVERVKSYLEDNLCRNIKLEELGSMLYLSPHYIGDTFKKITGSSLKEYHNMLRMQYAYRLLLETEHSISDIADQLGFESIHYFSKRFKERYTFPPSHLRKK